MSANDASLVRAVIADDEPVARAGLRALLDGVSWLSCVGEAGSGPATLELVERERPEVLFLDIEMPGANGLEVLRRLTHRPFVVFTTAWAQHAVTAFELGAVDYLLKPFGEERLRLALDRVRAGLGEPRENADDRLQEALGQGPMSRIFVRSGSAVIPVPVTTIRHLEAWGDYVRVHAESGSYVVHVPLQRLLERLDGAQFERVHRGHVVNLAHVRAFRSTATGYEAELVSGARVPVSRQHARAVRARGI